MPRSLAIVVLSIQFKPRVRCRFAFEQFAHLENVMHIVLGEARDDGAPARALFDEAVLRQLPQRVMHGRSAHVELLGERDFADDCGGPETSGDNGVEQRFIHDVGKTCVLDATLKMRPGVSMIQCTQ